MINTDGTVVCQLDNTGAANAFVQGGNPFGVPGVLGTSDGQPLTVGIGSGMGLRIVAGTASDSPKVTNGAAANVVSANGGTIAGGGRAATSCVDTDTGALTASCANQVAATWGAIGGGWANTVDASASYGVVSGGEANAARASNSTVAGGYRNIAGGDYSVVSGGDQNSAAATHTAVGGGFKNQTWGDYSAVVGGDTNAAYGTHSVIAGGLSNKTGVIPANGSGAYAAIGGGKSNGANGTSSVVAGGDSNTAGGFYSFIGGGKSNGANGTSSVVAGGDSNTAGGFYSFIGGGNLNTANGSSSVVAGGQSNVAAFTNATVGGGNGNQVNDYDGTIAGGVSNVVEGRYGAVLGGTMALARSIGQVAHAAGSFTTSAGTAQASEYVFRTLTTNETPGTMYLQGAMGLLSFEPGRAAMVDVQVVGLQDLVNGVVGTWTFRCMYEVAANGNGFVRPAGCNKTEVYKDVPAWDVNIGVAGGVFFDIMVFGAAASNIRWVATVRTTEVKW